MFFFFLNSQFMLQLIDFMLTTHPAYSKLVDLGKEQQKNIHVGSFYCLIPGPIFMTTVQCYWRS
jgi:hypothetical protein